jgi:hypothetical protein
MEIVIVIVAVIGYIAFRHWLQFRRREMIHRERLVAIEKGVELPPLEQEVRRSGQNVQRFLLLAGLTLCGAERAAGSSRRQNPAGIAMDRCGAGLPGDFTPGRVYGREK